jgi:endonuclease/exonuclease/phosphatase family metal-dependent hydrolase
MPNLRVVTFNCEWRKPKHPHGQEIIKRVLDYDPDIVCLTEAHTGYFTKGHELASLPHDASRPTRRKVILWSKTSWREVDERGHALILEGRYLAASTSTALGQIRVHGVVICYHMQDVRSGLGVWSRHLDFLDGLDRILPNDGRSTLLIGDFNQRIPRRHQTLEVYRALERIVLDRFALATGGTLMAVGKQAIDHICHSHDLEQTDVNAISNIGPDGAQISDHFGVAAAFVRAPR